ncbi:MAG TPA: hemolytic protein HlpA-like protein [Opitutae bacterium]|nr:hemolytic protein HlpA-like protein [Opitutae bacterium]
MNTPILLIIFNRPKHTQALVDALRAVKPSRIYVAADGPRPERESERAICDETRKVIDEIDWPCEVLKKYSDSNLGCAINVSSAISYAFQHEDQLIILEDDTIPCSDFFKFCEVNLEFHRMNQNISIISGTNILRETDCGEHSYYFSEIMQCWGWATWKDRWLDYDHSMKKWPQARNVKWLLETFKNPILAFFWRQQFDGVYSNAIDSWGYRWAFANARTRRLTINPSQNLIQNVGFGGDATHTTNQQHPCANIPVAEFKFPLVHPEILSVHREHEMKIYNKLHGQPSILYVLKSIVKKWIKR